MNNLLIVVPAYNECSNIESVISALKSLPMDATTLVIDDGSVDDTMHIARACGVGVVRHPCNLGYGAALQTGYKFAVEHGYHYVVQFDADGQHNAHDILPIYEKLVFGSVDLVIGSRFQGDGDFFPGGMKWLAIRLFRFLIFAFTHKLISDPTSGLKGLSRRVFSYYAEFNRLPADFPDADFVIDVLLHKWSVAEVPVGNKSRLSGYSMHSGLKPIVYMLKVLLSILVVVLAATIGARRRQA